MKKMGTHLVVDAWQAPAELLNDPERIRSALIEAIAAGEATLIDICVHQFSPHGVTATVTLAESHIAIHTWPEYGYFAADLFFCGRGKPAVAMKVLQQALQAGQVKMQEIERGFSDDIDTAILQSDPAYRLHRVTQEKANQETSPNPTVNIKQRLEASLS
ncbi:MAG: adenosylmethionine decarboxylase [Xenococcaceae cyanobacterium MO_188.B32]|nr:adenosylmethionine decarboxylase [Xenococcaceae cyanobacterium MO_188.B32]